MFDIHSMERIAIRKRSVYNYEKAYFVRIKSELCKSNLSKVISNCGDVDSACVKWYAIATIINKSIPKVCIKESNKAPWYDGEVKMPGI